MDTENCFARYSAAASTIEDQDMHNGSSLWLN